MTNPSPEGKLTKARRNGLAEVAAASDESIRYGGTGWVRSRQLSGTAEERSSTNMLSLAALGLVEKERHGSSKQAQYRWRITDAGRRALHSTTDDKP